MTATCEQEAFMHTDENDPGKWRKCELAAGHSGRHMTTYCGRRRFWPAREHAPIQLERDDHGFIAGVSVGGYWILHLKASVRGERYAQWIVDRLNGSDASMPAKETP